jgi:hypothetical protein
MLLWMGTNRCLSEAGTEPKARLNSEGEAAARAEADEKLFASWIEEVEKGGMRLVHPIGDLGLELLKGGQEAGEAEVNGVGMLSFVESESVAASDESLRYLIKLLKSDKPGVVPLIDLASNSWTRKRSISFEFG